MSVPENELELELAATVAVRWADIDSLGHVNHARYHEYLEQGRSALFRERAGSNAHGFVLARVELDHVAEVKAGTPEVEVHLRVATVARSSVRLEHEIRTPDGAVVARGNSVMVAWDQARRRKRTIGDAERRRLLTPLGG